MKIVIPSKLTDKFVPDLESVNLLEYFLISAVCSVLGIRMFLQLTSFPQLGGAGLHIAHMLWGGLLMLAAIVVFASFINSQSKVLASILGGLGFGAFIDELGKFVTADNNYFYKPTIGFIYIIFICIFLFIRWLSSTTKHSPKTYLANAIEGLKELVIMDLDTQEQKRSLNYLRKSDKDDPVVKMLYQTIQIAQAKKKEASLYGRLRYKVFEWYKNASHVKIISKVLVGVFILASGINLLSAIIDFVQQSGTPFVITGALISAIAVALLVLVGVRFYLKKDRLKSYLFLQRATLVAIFISQFFLFIQNQLAGLAFLAVFVSVYLILKYAIRAETAI